MAWMSTGALVVGGALRTAGWLAQADAAAPSTGGSLGGGGGGGAPGGGSGGWIQLVIFGGIFLMFYLLVLRPQQKRASTHKSFLDSLTIGQRVVTMTGLFGKITAIEGNEIKLEIADRVVVRMLKTQVAGLEANAAEAVASLNQR